MQKNNSKTFNTNGVPSRMIIQKNKEGVVIGDFESITEAAKSNNVSRTSIVNNLKGRSKYCGGYKYEYR